MIENIKQESKTPREGTGYKLVFKWKGVYRFSDGEYGRVINGTDATFNTWITDPQDKDIYNYCNDESKDFMCEPVYRCGYHIIMDPDEAIAAQSKICTVIDGFLKEYLAVWPECDDAKDYKHLSKPSLFKCDYKEVVAEGTDIVSSSVKGDLTAKVVVARMIYIHNNVKGTTL
jgi:hypothetical protein